MPNMALGPFVVFNKSLTRAQSISLALHGTLIAVLLIPALAPPPGPLKIRDTWLVFSGLGNLDPLQAKAEEGKAKRNRGGGGGGARENQPATKGNLPPFTRIQFTPPGKPQPNADLQMPPSIQGPNVTLPAPYPLLGDPNGRMFNDSQGPGGGNGHGDKCCGGNGPGDGRGHGPGKEQWMGGGEGEIEIAGRRGAGTPVCAYCPNPQFTDEAIRVRYQGAVTLRLIVTAHGLPANISMLRAAGLGLDERAIEAVRNWRFTPARRDGRPIATWVVIEVQFRQF
jgi:TonB family protein